MSRSNPEERQVNPARRWLQWEAEYGCFSYWDKDLKERIKVDETLTFLVLDELATVTGYAESLGSSVYANEVRFRDLGTIPLSVKANKTKEEIISGLWKDIKEKVAVLQLSFGTSIYVLIRVDGQLELANIKLKGGGLSSWMEFSKTTNVLEGAVCWNGKTEQRKHGRTEYLIPVFEKREASQETLDRAIQADRDVLQPYLTGRVESKVSGDCHEVYERPEETDVPF